MPADAAPAPDLAPALIALGNALDRFRFRLPGPDGASHEEMRAEAVRAIREYLLPRLDDRDAPLVVALFGESGSGKSSVANAIAQRKLGTPGPVRPSTRRAVVWAHRSHADRYWREFVRQVRQQVGPEVETIVGDDPMTANLTLIDTPPLDYVDDEGTAIAKEVLAVTDLCVFVASALRYADAAAWEFVRLVSERGVPILFVLNRLPADVTERAAVLADYARRLAEDGLLLEADPKLLFGIAEQEPDPGHGGVPNAAVAALRKELEQLTDPALRRALARQANLGAVAGLVGRVRPLVEAAGAEAGLVEELLETVEDTYRRAGRYLEEQLVTAGPGGADPEALAESIARVVTHVAGTAAQETAAAWDRTTAGRAILDGAGAALWRHGADTPLDAERVAAEWVAGASEVPGDKGGPLRRRRRRRAGALVPVAALSPGEEIPQPLVRELGRDDADTLIRWARRSLVGDMREVLSRDAARFVAALGDPSALPGLPEALAAALERVQAAAGVGG